MVENRSVPTSVMLAQVSYADVGLASTWLCKAFGFVEHYRYGDPEAPMGAQLRRGDAVIMLSGGGDGGRGTVLTIFVESAEQHQAIARANGAEIVEELNETMYGEQQYAVRDHSGRVWMFSTHAKDVDPAEWATVATPSRTGMNIE